MDDPNTSLMVKVVRMKWKVVRMRERWREWQRQLRIERDGVSEPRGKLTLQMLDTIFYSPGIPETDRI